MSRNLVVWLLWRVFVANQCFSQLLPQNHRSAAGFLSTQYVLGWRNSCCSVTKSGYRSQWIESSKKFVITSSWQSILDLVLMAVPMNNGRNQITGALRCWHTYISVVHSMKKEKRLWKVWTLHTTHQCATL